MKTKILIEAIVTHPDDMDLDSVEAHAVECFERGLIQSPLNETDQTFSVEPCGASNLVSEAGELVFLFEECHASLAALHGIQNSHLSNEQVPVLLREALNELLLLRMEVGLGATLLQKLMSEGGAIVRSDACSEMEAANAAGTGRMEVSEDGIGLVLRYPEWLERAMAARKELNALKLEFADLGEAMGHAVGVLDLFLKDFNTVLSRSQKERLVYSVEAGKRALAVFEPKP